MESLKERSHQMRMKHYAQMIYMLSQCKGEIDNPAGVNYTAQIERLGRLIWVEKSELWRIFAPR